VADLRSPAEIAGAAALTAAVALAALVLAGCGTPITHGTVLAREDDPAYTTTIQVPQYRTSCTEEEVYEGSGHYGEEDVCTQVLAYYLPVPEYVPERWQLEIKQGTRTGWVDVSQGAYSRAVVGKRWRAAQ
jgi:hypothetical protein